MKKITTSISLLICFYSSFCQMQADTSIGITNSNLSLSLLLKRKRQKNAGFILLSGGFITASIGVLSGSDLGDLGDDFDGKNKNDGVSLALQYTGLAMMIGSIPLFIASKKNKHKAMSLSFKNQMIYQLQNKSLVKVPVPSIGVKVQF